MAVRNEQPDEPSKNPSRADSPRRPRKTAPKPMAVVNPRAAGIDVHSDVHVVCVPADADPKPVRTFGANTVDLEAIADWLTQCGVATAAMESTGVYWIPLFELLEARGFEVLLVEPGQLSHCGARPKTDVLDAQWIQRLHSYGLLRGSFRPPDAVIALRGFYRQRQMLIRYASHHVQHMQKALEQMNVKLTEVVSDITGLTGMAIIEDILSGERDPRELAKKRDWRCKHSEPQIADALEGTWRVEHLFALQQAYESYWFMQRQITACDQQIEAELAKLADRAEGKSRTSQKRKRSRKSNAMRFDAAGPLFRALGVDLTAIEGIDVGTAFVVLAETGADVSRFSTEKDFASWLGLCPPQHTSNKRSKHRRSHKGRNRLAIALRMAAQSVGRTMTPLGIFYRRIRSRIGGLGAVKATAHKLAVLIYRMLKYGEEYVKQSMAEYESMQRAKLLAALQRKAAQLGHQLLPLAPAT